ncbi:MAG: pitrilysin family protein [Candidatus Ratteibacteria bacterium]|nr:pitrilysin family protein [Candidatus Ratteibacteria bacterium]
MKITTETLPSGLKVLIKQTSSNEIVAIDFFIGSGSGAENRKEAGLTYLTSRLFFKGTEDKNFKQIAEGFDSLGGIWGLSVERDFSEIHLIIPKKYWKEGLSLFAEVLTMPAFPEKEVQKEKKLISQEIRSLEDNPFEFAHCAFNENIYGSHPYGKPTFGFLDTISRFSRTDLLKQYKRCFSSQNAVITFVGNLDAKEVIPLVQENFRALPSGEPSVFHTQAFQSRGKRTVIKKSDLQQSMIFLGFRAAAVENDDYPVLKAISALLGGGMSSRMFENIRDKKGIGYALGSFYPTRVDTSTFVFYVGVQPERVKEAEAAFREEIRKIQAGEISEEELQKIKNYLTGNFYLAQQRNKDQAYYLGWFETIGLGSDFGAVYLKNIAALKPHEIKEAAKKYFRDDKAVLLILSPEEL